MKLDVYFTPAEIAGAELPARVVVIDVLRATSTMVEALANGARAIFPVATADEAVKIGQNVGRDSVLLCGERKGLPIEGFDLSNAPPEFTPDRVRDRSLAMTTTNGTRAVRAVAERLGGAADAGEAAVLIGSFLNLGAVAERLRGGSGAEATGAVALVCAGREGRFALEDALLAGALVRTLEESGETLEPNDGALAARSLAGGKRGLERVFAETSAGRRLLEIGRAEDLGFCAQVDRTAIVPRLRDRKITAE